LHTTCSGSKHTPCAVHAGVSGKPHTSSLAQSASPEHGTAPASFELLTDVLLIEVLPIDVLLIDVLDRPLEALLECSLVPLLTEALLECSLVPLLTEALLDTLPTELLLDTLPTELLLDTLPTELLLDTLDDVPPSGSDAMKAAEHPAWTRPRAGTQSK
jgi:hypothetical protein